MKNADRSTRQGRTRGWWVHLLWGLSAIVLGVLLVARPVETGLFLVQVMAIFWLVGGVIDLIHALVARDKGAGWSIVVAIVGILAGLVILGHPIVGLVLTVTTLFMVAAFSAIFFGVTNIVEGARKRDGESRPWSRFFLGVLQVVIGIFMLWHPVLGTLAFSSALGFVAIAGGVGAVGLALGARKRNK